RYFHLPGVQTCALPISSFLLCSSPNSVTGFSCLRREQPFTVTVSITLPPSVLLLQTTRAALRGGSGTLILGSGFRPSTAKPGARPEERRVGNECPSRHF